MIASEEVRYGIIGSGMMGQEHIRNLVAIPDSKVAAIADPHEPSRRAAAALVPGEPAVFADACELIASGACDALVIAAPNDTHTGLLEKIFAAPRALPILVEKPICTEPRDLELLRSAAGGYGAPIWVGMEYRYMPPVSMMLKELRGGTVGTPRMIAMREHRFPFMPKVNDWNRFARRTGGTLVEKCCHFFDLMRLIAQSEAVRVYASGAADFNHRDERYDGQQPDILDNAFVVVDFANGMRASLDLCMFAEGAWWQEAFSVTGDKARIDCFVPATRGYDREVVSELVISPRRLPRAPEHRTVPVDPQVLAAGAHYGATYYEHLNFRKAIMGEGPVEVSVEDGLKAVAIGMAAEMSVREHRVVEVDGISLR